MPKSLFVLALLCASICASTAKAAVSLTQIAQIPEAVYVTSPPNDDRLFILTHDGVIWVKDGLDPPHVFMDMSSEVNDSGEQGLQSIVFAPDYATTGKFYVNYNGPKNSPMTNAANLRISQFTNLPAADDDAANSAARLATEQNLLTIQHTAELSHNGGTMNFGPDGHLYISVGDGGGQGGGDKPGNAQNLTANPGTVHIGGSDYNVSALLGKILRIDPDGVGGYSIPAGQPLTTGTPPVTAKDEIWAYGFRNPFRWSFDRLTGDMIIGDVGQGAYEEVDYVPAAQQSIGMNFGWNNREGLHAFPGGVPLLPGTTETKPVIEYPHEGSPTLICAVIGGYVDREPGSGLYGKYIFGDACNGKISTACLAQPAATSVSRDLGVSASGNIHSFGQDSQGHIYVISSDPGPDGVVSRIDDPGTGDACPPPPSGGPPGLQVVPKASITFSKLQPVGKRGYVKVVATCDAACSASARAKFSRKGIKHALSSRLLRTALAANKRTTLKIKLSASTRRALRHALKAKRKTTATVTVTVAGGTSPKPVKVTVSG